MVELQDRPINKIVGGTFWFEYHCWESPESCDAELWYHSHQKVLVLKCVEKGYGKTFDTRIENSHLRHYKIRFSDGYEHEAVEDELMLFKRDFYRPSPPRLKREEKQNAIR